MSTIPYISPPALLGEYRAEQPRLHRGTLLFVIAQLGLLLAISLSPLRSALLMMLALLPALVVSLFQPFVGLCCLFAFTLFDSQVAVAAEAFSSSKLLAVFVAVGFFIRGQRREYTLVPPDPLTKLALTWAFLCLLSALWSSYPRATLIAAITQVLLAGSLLMGSQMIDTRARLATALVSMSIACTMGAVIMLAFPQIGTSYATMGRTTIGEVNANTVARTLTMGIFAAVYLIWVLRSWFLRLAMIASIPVTMVGILACQTRAALACIFLGLAGGGILGLRGSIFQRLLMFSILALCTFAGFTFVQRTHILGTEYLERWKRLEGGVNVRTYIWKTGIVMWLNHPALGVGYGNFEEHYTSVAVDKNRLRLGLEREAHNTYLRALCELGPIGVSLIASMIAWMVIYSFRIRPGPMANLGFATVVAIGAMTFTGTLTHLKFLWYMMAIIIAMARTIPLKEAAQSSYGPALPVAPAEPNPYAR